MPSASLIGTVPPPTNPPKRRRAQTQVTTSLPATDRPVVGRSIGRRIVDWTASQLPPRPAGTPELDRETMVIFVVATVLLIVFQYFGKAEFYRNSALEALLAPFAARVFGTHTDVAPYAYWGAMSLFLRTLIPLTVVALLYNASPRDFGWRWRGTLAHAPLYAGLWLFMLPLLLAASTMPSFQAKYPFYRGAMAGGPAFWGYELAYGLQFMGVEAFFRGFLTFSLFRKFGYYALFIMTIPYVMIHFNKPLPEVFGALAAGLVLGALALRSKSFIPGFFLHWAIGATMDVLAIAKANGGWRNAMQAII